MAGMRDGWVLDAVPDGLWVLDEQGRTLYANARFVAMLQLDPDQVEGFWAGGRGRRAAGHRRRGAPTLN